MLSMQLPQRHNGSASCRPNSRLSVARRYKRIILVLIIFALFIGCGIVAFRIQERKLIIAAEGGAVPQDSKLAPPPTQDSANALVYTCIREVLALLGRQSFHGYALLHLTSPLPLPIRRLSPLCRRWLHLHPPSQRQLDQLHCFLTAPPVRGLSTADLARIERALYLAAFYFRWGHVVVGLHGKSALGSWLVHGRLAYDDSIELFFFPQQEKTMAEVIDVMRERHPNLFKPLKAVNGFMRLTIIRDDGSRLMDVDLFPYQVSMKGHLEMGVHPFTLSAQTLFPLVQRPFNGVLFPAFRNIESYILRFFGTAALSQCKPPDRGSGPTGSLCHARSVNCSDLSYFFGSVVHSQPTATGMLEILTNRSHILDIFYSPNSL